MEPSSTPWRVFDTPADGSVGNGTAGPSAAPGAAGASASSAAAGATLAGIPNQWLAIGGVLGALVIGAIAIVVAMSASGTAVAEGPRVDGGPSTAGASFGSGGEIVVDVTGAVVTPGVFHLESGSRVGDAIEAAGGFSPRVDVEAVGKALNLAAILTDGAQVHVPSRDDAATSGGGSGGPPGPGGGTGGGLVNVNTATQAELEALPGIGPVTAGKIIESRAGSPFKSVDELRERGLVGQKTFDTLKPLISVG